MNESIDTSALNATLRKIGTIGEDEISHSRSHSWENESILDTDFSMELEFQQQQV
jgi:hypothetical protein